MAKQTKSADLHLIDLFRQHITVWPLFGLQRLVRVQHRHRSGVLYCDNVARLSDSITFSRANVRTAPYTIGYSSPIQGVIGEPRMTIGAKPVTPDLSRFRKDGRAVQYSFTPKRGETYSMECTIYKALDTGHRYLWSRTTPDSLVANWEITLDVSAYLAAGYTIVNPRCEYDPGEAAQRSRGAAREPPRHLTPEAKGAGVWQWTIGSAPPGALMQLAWALESGADSHASKVVNLKKLDTELSVNARLAQNLHNFVRICHYYAAGFRSLNKIAHEMISYRSILNRSLESLEGVAGTELIHRTKGKGLILVTPAGEAVLDWWSQFYMRWTPIIPESSPTSGTEG